MKGLDLSEEEPVAYLVYLVFHPFVSWGWNQFALDVWDSETVLGSSRSAWGVHEHSINKSLSVSVCLFPFLLDNGGREQFALDLVSRGMNISSFDVYLWLSLPVETDKSDFETYLICRT